MANGSNKIAILTSASITQISIPTATTPKAALINLGINPPF